MWKYTVYIFIYLVLFTNIYFYSATVKPMRFYTKQLVFRPASELLVLLELGFKYLTNKLVRAHHFIVLRLLNSHTQDPALCGA